ncbi:leucine-rich repeat domain-containing protein [Dawidia soli]|uniref:Leucine-rich repeat domain-containing protein n=1 Tax=Dawidia soli TaxID=2782352 RepID=A0AAP2D7H0_9BACT|nr:leucine-rich repeat domain-containing protein [Dawidia soli]MBT1686833.1 leucine-rich repeat domain-containing protein [Dawidia soli]
MSNPLLLPYEALRARIDAKLYNDIDVLSHDHVLFFEGDTRLTETLDKDWAQSLLQTLDAEASADDLLIVVNGNLTVEGDIAIGDYHPCLLVIGNVACEVLVSGDDTIFITGDAHITHAFYGYYNDGSIQIDGTTHVPYVINSDHSSGITPSGAILINAYSDHHDFFDYDYLSGALPEVVVPEALNKGTFDAWKFIEWVRAGQSPFVEGAKPMRIANAEALEKLVSGTIKAVQELDWSDRNERKFPDAILRLRYLRKLDLSKNPITELPADLDRLENLEELHLESCRLTHLPDSIGNLKKLRVLTMSGNHDMTTLPETLANLEQLTVLKVNYMPLNFPASFARLDRLEEISLYQCYTDKTQPAPFPEFITRLKNLKRLDLRENWLASIPESFLQVQTLEEFVWTGGRTKAPNLIDYAQFKNLKKLVISRKFAAWKDIVFTITSLEHLSIDRNKEDKQYFGQDMLDLWIEMMPEQDEESRKHLEWMLAHKQAEPDGRFSVLLNPGMKPEELRGISKLEKLKSLDLSFNHLTGLPEEFFQLKNLEYIDLQYNKFTDDVKERITRTFPTANIVWQ